VRDRPRAHVRGSPRADPGQLPRLVQWDLEGPHGRVATPETLALHDEPQGRRGPVPRHLPLLLRRRRHPRPDLPHAARGPLEYVPPAGRVQPGRDDPRAPHAPLGPDPARRGLRELLRPDPNRRADMAFPRLNALSYWVYLASGLLALSSFFAGGGTADWGWTTYAPLNTVEFSPAIGGSMM